MSLSHCLGYSHSEFENLQPGVGGDVTEAAVLTCRVGLGWSPWHAPGDIKYKMCCQEVRCCALIFFFFF